MAISVFRGRLFGGGARLRFLPHVIAVIAVVAIVLIARPGLQRDRPPAPGGAASSTVDAPSQPPGEGEVYVPSPTSPEDERTAQQVATGFTRAWAHPALGPEEWWRGVRPYAEPGYAQLLRTVEPSNVPATRVVGPARTVTTEPGLVVVDVPTDAGTCRVTVAKTSATTGWQVSTHGWVPRSSP
jgi:hypothetical protein